MTAFVPVRMTFNRSGAIFIYAEGQSFAVWKITPRGNVLWALLGDPADDPQLIAELRAFVTQWKRDHPDQKPE